MTRSAARIRGGLRWVARLLVLGGWLAAAGCSYIENEFLFLERVRPQAAEPVPGLPPPGLAARA